MEGQRIGTPATGLGTATATAAAAEGDAETEALMEQLARLG